VNEEVAGPLPLEESGSFLNLEGRAQSTVASATQPFSSFVEDFIPLFVLAVGLKAKNSFTFQDLYDFEVLDQNTLERLIPGIAFPGQLSGSITKGAASF